MNKVLRAEFPQLEHPRTGVKKLLQHIRSAQSEDADILNVHVSHDTILAAFVYTLLGKTLIEEHEWPRMMEGVYLWFEGDSIQGVWRGQCFEQSFRHFN
jgi:hypothetical protein